MANSAELHPLSSMLAASPVQLSIQSNQELASLLGWNSVRLLTLLGRNKKDHYSKLFIKKKGASGSLRVLHNPDSLMRVAQYRILNGILEGIPIPEYIYAFERGRSIPSMAARHVGHGTVISLDLKDFFSSIKQSTLKTVFEHLGVAAAPAITLSELCTYESFVPQGALTSPKVSNIVTTLTFGPIIKQYCEERGYTLTIYADDVTISCQDDIMKDGGFAVVKQIIDFVSQTVNQFGFRINRKKTKVMRPFQRQYVCGVVVNEKVNLQAKERKKLRAIVHNCNLHGIENEAAKNNVSAELFISQIGGKLNWLNQLNPSAGADMVNRFNTAKAAYAELLSSRPAPVSDAVVEDADEQDVPWDSPVTV